MPEIKRIAYLTTARLPTEKAHGYQICKMCEAFALRGAEVTLLHPFRSQPRALEGQSVFSYYSVRQCFSVKTLPNLDVFKVERLVPAGVFSGLFFLHALLWSFWAVRHSRRYGADMYYTRDIPLAYWLILQELPTVLELHTVPNGAQRVLLKKICSKKSLEMVAALTTFIKQRLIAQGFNAESIAVLPDAVDAGMFSAEQSKYECRRQLGLPEHVPIIGYIGRFTAMGMEKGIATLIEALQRLSGHGVKNAAVLCVGGPMETVPRYRDLGRQLGLADAQVMFFDRVPNAAVPVWIKTCDVVTIPWPWNEFSAYFTSPMKLFEYMASGVPIVASDLPSLREVLRHGGNAWLVKPGDPAALAEGISHLLRTPGLAESLARQALQDVRQYTWQERAARVLREAGIHG